MSTQPGLYDGVADMIASRFHETYERLAPDYDYKTRSASAVLWHQLPQANQKLMIATVQYLLDNHVISVPYPGKDEVGAELDIILRTWVTTWAIMGMENTGYELADLKSQLKTLLKAQLDSLLSDLNGLEIDVEATTKYIGSVNGSENDILNMEIEADDRHDILSDVANLIQQKRDSI